jgi:hypothetical protein
MELDDKKSLMEKSMKDKDRLKASLENIMQEFEIKKNKILKNLTDKLKLSEKFVKFSQF